MARTALEGCELDGQAGKHNCDFIADNPGEGLGVAADTGGLIRGERVDVYRETYRGAMDYGRQRVIVAWPNS